MTNVSDYSMFQPSDTHKSDANGSERYNELIQRNRICLRSQKQAAACVPSILWMAALAKVIHTLRLTWGITSFKVNALGQSAYVHYHLPPVPKLLASPKKQPALKMRVRILMIKIRQTFQIVNRAYHPKLTIIFHRLWSRFSVLLLHCFVM